MSEPRDVPGVDPAKPSTARIYDYYLGGKDNFEADRAAAEQVAGVLPEAPALARANRSFLVRAVRELAGLGIGQYIDLGAGIPTSPNVHEVARESEPGARVVYVDNDPVVLAHSRALRNVADGITSIDLDIRDAARIPEHPDVREMIDFDRPVGVLLVAVLHFFDDQDARKILDGVRSWLAPGGYLGLSAGTCAGRHLASQAARAQAIYAKTGTQATGRAPEEIRKLLHGFTFLPPGITPINEWLTGHQEIPGATLLCGLARRTA